MIHAIGTRQIRASEENRAKDVVGLAEKQNHPFNDENVRKMLTNNKKLFLKDAIL